jgi:hypothetical protein
MKKWTADLSQGSQEFIAETFFSKFSIEKYKD